MSDEKELIDELEEEAQPAPEEEVAEPQKSDEPEDKLTAEKKPAPIRKPVNVNTGVKSHQQRRRDGQIDKGLTKTIENSIQDVARGKAITKQSAKVLLQVLKSKVSKAKKSSFGSYNQKQAYTFLFNTIDQISDKASLDMATSKSLVRFYKEVV